MNASLWDAQLGSVADDIASGQPAPGGVAAAAVAATLGVSLAIKVLEITGQRPDLRRDAERVALDLRVTADADCAAVRAYLRTRNPARLKDAIDIPLRAARAAVRALDLCSEAEPSVPAGLLAADLRAGRDLLTGALRAILACIDANLQNQPSMQTAAEVASLRARIAS